MAEDRRRSIARRDLERSDHFTEVSPGLGELDVEAFDACVAERSGRSRVDRDLDAGREAGVSGTPTFFVNGIPITGGGSADDFAKLIDEELERLRAGG